MFGPECGELEVATPLVEDLVFLTLMLRLLLSFAFSPVLLQSGDTKPLAAIDDGAFYLASFFYWVGCSSATDRPLDFALALADLFLSSVVASWGFISSYIFLRLLLINTFV